MPNWCENTLEIKGSEEDVFRWVERAASIDDPQSPQPIHFEAFVVPPRQVLSDDSKLIDWRYANWGTKWEPSFFDMERSCGGAIYRFETAWAPPLEWVLRVADQYPDLRFRIVYAEPGMDFSGEMIVRGEEVLKDEEGVYEDFQPA